MKSTDTISVNPGKTTLGHEKTEAIGSLFRTRVIDEPTTRTRANLVSVLFPSVSTGLSSYSRYALPLRALFATILIVSGLSVMQNNILFHQSFGIGLTEVILGAMLALGLLTRPAMLISAAYFAITTALSLRHGVSDITSLSLMFGCVVMSVVGSGKYSCDFYLRRLILKSLRRKPKVLDYKAFHYSGY